VKAKAVSAYRQQNSPFKSVDDLKKVPGISDKLLAQLKDQVTVGK
jgi:competence protein ComEA